MGVFASSIVEYTTSSDLKLPATVDPPLLTIPNTRELYRPLKKHGQGITTLQLGNLVHINLLRRFLDVEVLLIQSHSLRIRNNITLAVSTANNVFN